MLLHLTLQITATAHGKCLVKTEKALELWVEDMNRKRVCGPGGSVLPVVSGIHCGSWNIFPIDYRGLLYSAHYIPIACNYIHQPLNPLPESISLNSDCLPQCSKLLPA